MRALRLLDTGAEPARRNVAVSAAILEAVGSGAPDTLRFHAYPLSAILGRNQDAATELDLTACRQGRIEVARRVTGGGAVVMGPGVLAWDLVLGAGGRDPSALGARLGGALVDALGELGLAAVLATPGSVEIGGRKVSGSAGRMASRAVLHQATLLLDLAATAPLSLLRRRTEAGRPTADPTHRVTSLAEAVGAAPDLARLKTTLAASFSAALGRALAPGELTAAEVATADRLLADEIGSDAFVLSGERTGGLGPIPPLQGRVAPSDARRRAGTPAPGHVTAAQPPPSGPPDLTPPPSGGGSGQLAPTEVTEGRQRVRSAA